MHSPSTSERQSSRIVLATFGSLGDLHPFLALAAELKRLGHTAVLATAPHYEATVRAAGFEFAAAGPPISPEDPDLLRRLMLTTRGPEYLFRRMFLPHLPELYCDLEVITADADLLIASEVVFAAPLLAEKTGLPWVSVLLSPISFFSPFDAPVLPPLPWTARFHGLPVVLQRAMLLPVRLVMRVWARPLQRFRRRLGLPALRDALLAGKFQAPLVLAMFSRSFAAAQPDWPAHTVQPGFAFYAQPPDLGADADSIRLHEFLQAGDPPLVFTLGSAAVHVPGDFFLESVRAADRVGRRAVLLCGRADLRAVESDRVLALAYADHGRLFPRAAVVVHQGGIGTTAEALRAGVPSLVVPFNFDQPDNAARAVRLGVARTLSRRRYNARSAAAELRTLLQDGRYRDRAATLAAAIQQENGARDAAMAIQALLDQ